ncbi:MAG: glycosyltransferase [Bryobacteraceae bacterium]
MGNVAIESPSQYTNWRQLRHGISGLVKGFLRRQSEILFPNREAREYRLWIAERVRERQSIYREALEPGLLSVLTPVWNGSPVGYLKRLAESVADQNPSGACEWVVLDNGCTNAGLLSYLANLRAHSWIRVCRAETNIGIIRGLRYCLEHARGRYFLPVDADDCLYPDAFQVVTSFIRRAGYPALLYTDEDKVIGTRFFQPYLKPDWDPVLFLNSAYIAHLGVIDREKALELGAYSDSRTEGSPDWDLFVRFMIAGYTPVHIPEVLYSWRVHAHSTADDAATKPYIHSSQKSALRRFLDAQPNSAKFSVEYSPLLGGAAHWHFSRKHNNPRSLVSAVLTSGSGRNGKRVKSDYPELRRISVRTDANVDGLAPLAKEMAAEDGFVHLIGEDVEIDVERKECEWAWEALTLFELHPDAVMIGGRIRNREGVITEAGRYFGFRGACGCPDRGRSVLDPGYFGQVWKQRSVSAVSTQFAVIRAVFLLKLLAVLPRHASLAFLGAWAGAHALRSGERIVYSPFLSGVSDLDWDSLVTPSERNLFSEVNKDLIPDRRFYSRHLSLEKPFTLDRTLSSGTKLKIAS